MPATTSGIKAGQAFVELGVSDRLSTGLRRAEARLKAFGSTLKSMGQQLATAGAAVAIPLTISARVFATFEQRMARVRALTGASERDFTRLADKAKALGETTVFSASQAAEAMSFFALAGFKVDQILTAIGPTLSLAAAGQVEIAQAADIAAKIMAGMGLEADKLGGVVDVLAKAMTTANTDILMLGDAMKFVGPIAKSAGISLEEIVASIQLLSNAGIQGDMAGTTLRGALISLTSPSAEASKKLEELGVNVADSAGNVRSLVDIIADLESATAGMGTAERLETIGTIFPARQAAGMAELISQGSNQLRAFTDALSQAGGTADRIARTQLEMLTGDVVLLKSALEGVAIAIGESLVKGLRAGVQTMVRVTGQIAAWVKENRRMVVAVAAIGAALLGLGATLIVAGVAAKALAFTIGALTKVVWMVASPIRVLATILPALASPAGIVVAALAVMTTGFILFSKAGREAISWLGDKFRSLRSLVGEVATAVIDALASSNFKLAVMTKGFILFSKAGREAISWLGDKFRSLRSLVGEVATAVIDALASGNFKLAAKIAWTGVKLIYMEATKEIREILIAANDVIQNFFIDAWFGGLSIAEKAWHAMQVAWINVTTAMGEIWTNFSTTFRQVWAQAIATVIKGIMKIHDWVKRNEKLLTFLAPGLVVADRSLFGDEGFDSEAVIKQAQSEADEKVAELEANRQAKLAGLNQQRNRRLFESSNAHAEAMEDIAKRWNKVKDEVGKKTLSDLQGTRNELKMLEQEFRKRQLQVSGLGPANFPLGLTDAFGKAGQPSRFDRAKAAFEELEDLLSREMNKKAGETGIVSSGTYNPIAAARRDPVTERMRELIRIQREALRLQQQNQTIHVRP